MGELVVGWLVAGALFGGVGVWVSRSRGRSAVEGAALGFLLGPLGLLLAALAAPGVAKAPACPRGALTERERALGPVAAARSRLRAAMAEVERLDEAVRRGDDVPDYATRRADLEARVADAEAALTTARARAGV